MVTARTTDIRNMNPAMSKPLSSSRQEEKAVKVPATDEDVEFSTESSDIRRTHVEAQRMIESAQRLFKGATLKRRTGTKVESEIVNLLQTTTEEAANGEKTLVN